MRTEYTINVAYDGDFENTRDIHFDHLEAFIDWVANVDTLIQAGYRKDVNIEMDIKAYK